MEQRIIDSEDKLFEVMDFIKNSDIEFVSLYIFLYFKLGALNSK